jgi:hypothetical protein
MLLSENSSVSYKKNILLVFINMNAGNSEELTMKLTIYHIDIISEFLEFV